MVKILPVLLVFGLGLKAQSEELSVVSGLNIERYLGQWHEIARFPNKYQKDCQETVAQYSKNEKGLITVKNSCKLSDGSEKEAIGLAKIEDPAISAKLKVNFVPGWLRWTGIGWGNYWVIDLGNEYEYAVVSEPKKESLWILSRSETLTKNVYEKIIEKLKINKFDLDKLIVSSKQQAVLQNKI